ncbi:hypothetical protein [Streptomyces sp. NBC_00343]|uniref:hypothetical protein n=1 Tax=Streptomyces sp. NBC_00343 TaxID=2975719 RepID=UPI002E2BDCE9|nr:hypothetical protein [Streptomyces sp. NBC_00343]
MAQEIDITRYTPSVAEVDGAQRPVLIPERRWYDALLSTEADAAIDRWNEKVFQDLNSPTASADCWTWTAALSADGYGEFSLGGQKARAHHILWSLEHGSPPQFVFGPKGWEQVHVGHLCHDQDETCEGGPQCRHRQCVNPDHLALQSHSANIRAGHAGEHHRRKTECPSGHAYVEHGFVYTDPRGTTRRYCRACQSGQRAAEFVGSRKLLGVAA